MTSSDPSPLYEHIAESDHPIHLGDADGADQLGGSDHEPINILLVDDEPKNLTALESVLDNPAYRLVRAESADQALMALIAEEFAVLILDIQMPDMNGFELAQMVKQRKRTASLPIIFLTAYYSQEDRVLEGYSTGAVDYLHKPINPAILRSKVAVFAELYRKTRECNLANHALLTEVTERRSAQEELSELARKLEERVAERTSELTAANAALRSSEAALKEADRRKDRFLAILAHELRNPLAPIRNAVKIVQLQNAQPSDRDWANDIIDRQSRHLTHLVDDLLDINRINTGKLALRLEAVKLDEVLQGAVETSEPLIQQLVHQLKVDLPREALVLNGDVTRLSQIFSNLLNNAAKYTEEGGTISLTAVREEGQVCVSVRDDGIGIPADMLPHVFEMFTQVDRNPERSQGGLGIGLQLVKALVEMHGGTIAASSAGLNQGSEFVVRLPLASQPAPVAEAPPNPVETKRNGRLRILVVDDNKDNLESLRFLLKFMGHDVRTALEGAQGIAVANEFRPEVVLLDIGMPEMDGHEVCRRIRSHDWGRPMVLIAQTGWGQDEDRRCTKESGFNHHLVKPVSHATLKELLAKISETRDAAAKS